MKLKLKSNHPAMNALEKVFKCMEENNVQIEHAYGAFVIYHNNESYVLEDLDDGIRGVAIIPNGVEYKLTYEKEHPYEDLLNKIKVARFTRDDPRLDDEAKYNKIFGLGISKLANDYGFSTEYYDPDTTYIADVNAYLDMLDILEEKIKTKFYDRR